MQLNFITSIFTFSFFLIYSNSFGQELHNQQSDEKIIREQWIKLHYDETKPTPKLIKIPDRKYDSPMFCNEFLSFHSGFIINSIVSKSSGKTIDVNTTFFYIDTVTWELHKIKIPGSDTIESIVCDKSKLIASHVSNNKRYITVFSRSGNQEIIRCGSEETISFLDTAKWVKLGLHNSKLYALTPQGASVFESEKWKIIVKSSLDDFYIKKLNYRWSQACLPTINIQLEREKIWFLQEIVQERTARLLSLNILSGVLEDFYQEIGYIDHNHKQIFGYHVDPDQGIIVTASRLDKEFLVSEFKNDIHKVWIFRNQLNTSKGMLSRLFVSAISVYGDTTYLAGLNGLFQKTGDTISPLIFWENMFQTIKSEGNLHWEFIPRCITRINKEVFLIGNTWGGLYLINISKQTISCLDDKKYKRMHKLNLSQF